MPKQALSNTQMPQSGQKPKQAMTNPSDVFNQFSQGGSTIPLFQTLGKIGITRPEEQKLFFNYARQHGGYDTATGDFVIPKDKAMQLWDTMKNDKQFQLQLNQTRLQGIDQGVAKVKQFMSDPRTVSQMQPDDEQCVSQQLSELNELREALLENIRRITSPMQAGILNGADQPSTPNGAMGNGEPSLVAPQTQQPSKFSDFL